MICPRCNGTKGEAVDSGGQNPDGSFIETWKPCEFCQGSGEIQILDVNNLFDKISHYLIHPSIIVDLVRSITLEQQEFIQNLMDKNVELTERSITLEKCMEIYKTTLNNIRNDDNLDAAFVVIIDRSLEKGEMYESR